MIFVLLAAGGITLLISLNLPFTQDTVTVALVCSVIGVVIVLGVGVALIVMSLVLFVKGVRARRGREETIHE
jgi:beta-lactamase regulating signal transducer with metallopeptidase domain